MRETIKEWTAVQQTFQRIWGYTDLRESQREVVSNLLQGRDSLAIMATGGESLFVFSCQLSSMKV